MELPKGTISVRNLAYLALIENDQSSVESRICEMRYVSNHVACLLFVCFTQGAWSCLNQNIDVKARHSSFLRQVAVAFVWIGRGRMEEMGWVSVI